MRKNMIYTKYWVWVESGRRFEAKGDPERCLQNDRHVHFC